MICFIDEFSTGTTDAARTKRSTSRAMILKMAEERQAISTAVTHFPKFVFASAFILTLILAISKA